MTEIITERLSIKPTHKNCWSIFDQLDEQLIGKLFFREQWFNIILKPQSLHLGVATEASYGLMKALNSDQYKAKTTVPHAEKFLLNLGFKAKHDHFEVQIENLTDSSLYTTINQQLGVDTNKLIQARHHTAVQLVDSDVDCFNRPCKLHPKAHTAWQNMQQSACKDDVNLQLVSAFRSMPYQAQLFHNKLNKGIKLNDILFTNAAPGHSEHHTGCAIDITTEKFIPLEEHFEQSTAFTWLTEHAANFGFVLSYPQNNAQGIIYEPWHWRYHHHL